MSYLYKITLALIILAGAYTLIGIGNFKWMYHNIKNPDAEFQISGNENSDFVFVEFLNYGCGYCKKLYPIIKELEEVREDLKYIVRPITFDNGDTKDMTTRYAIAAGLQGKFNEFHEAFLEYPEQEIPDSFIEEISTLYNVDYNQLQKDANSKKVEKIIKENLSAMDHANITSVPSFLIGNNFYIITDENFPDLKQFLNTITENQ